MEEKVLNMSKAEMEALEQERKILEEIQKVKKQIECSKKDLDATTGEIQSAEDAIASGQIDVNQGRLKINELKKRTLEDEEEIQQLENRISALEQQLPKDTKNFDKTLFIENLRELLRTSDVRIGQIEKEAGCTAGYLSRLDKETNKSDPSIEFLVTASKLLGVSIDLLVKGHIREVTPTETFILEFISQLAKDTKKDELAWIRDSAEEIMDVEIQEGDMFCPHPLVRLYSEIEEGRPVRDGSTEYYSRFLKKVVEPVGNSYHVKMPYSENNLYLMKLRNIGGRDSLDTFYELYMDPERGEINPICCSEQVCDAIRVAMQELYSTIEISSSHVHISDATRSAIEDYMSKMKLPFD